MPLGWCCKEGLCVVSTSLPLEELVDFLNFRSSNGPLLQIRTMPVCRGAEGGGGYRGRAHVLISHMWGWSLSFEGSRFPSPGWHTRFCWSWWMHRSRGFLGSQGWLSACFYRHLLSRLELGQQMAVRSSGLSDCDLTCCPGERSLLNMQTRSVVWIESDRVTLAKTSTFRFLDVMGFCPLMITWVLLDLNTLLLTRWQK